MITRITPRRCWPRWRRRVRRSRGGAWWRCSSRTSSRALRCTAKRWGARSRPRTWWWWRRSTRRVSSRCRASPRISWRGARHGRERRPWRCGTAPRWWSAWRGGGGRGAWGSRWARATSPASARGCCSSSSRGTRGGGMSGGPMAAVAAACAAWADPGRAPRPRPGRGPLVAVDAEGRALPFDPARTGLDLPVAAAADRGVAGVLALVQSVDLALFQAITSARGSARGDVLLELGPRHVLLGRDAGPEVIRAVALVAQDLAAKRRPYGELDARFAKQVVVRRKASAGSGRGGGSGGGGGGT